MINPDLQAPDPESVDLSEWRKPKMESTKSWAYISVAVAVANVSQYKYVLCVVLRQTKDLYNVIMSKLTVEYSVSSQVVVAGTAKKGQSAIMGIVVQMQAIFKPIIHVFTEKVITLFSINDYENLHTYFMYIFSDCSEKIVKL